MSSIETVYRSSHPDVLAAPLAHSAAHDEWRKKTRALVDELGFPGHNPLIVGGFLQFRVTGIEYKADTKAPDGWRVTESAGHQVFAPDKRTKAGKQAAAALKTIDPPEDPRLNLPGMPASCWVGNRILNPGMALKNNDTVVYITWRCTVPELGTAPERTAKGDQVDLTIWERVKLSEYYAVLEAEEAAAALADQGEAETR